MSIAMSCPEHLLGVWSQDKGRSESLRPFLEGLMPAYIAYVAAKVTDAAHTTLRISCPTLESLEVVDKSVFGRNSTGVTLDGAEVVKATKNKRKNFMLSGSVADGGATSVIKCRLHERGEGWETRMERSIHPDEPHTLVERNVLQAPGEPDRIAVRYFTRMGEVIPPPSE